MPRTWTLFLALSCTGDGVALTGSGDGPGRGPAAPQDTARGLVFRLTEATPPRGATKVESRPLEPHEIDRVLARLPPLE